MQTKKIIAPTMQRALKMVKEEMGENAVILENRVKNNSVEILAATNILDSNYSKKDKLLNESNKLSDQKKQRSNSKFNVTSQKKTINKETASKELIVDYPDEEAESTASMIKVLNGEISFLQKMLQDQ